MIANEIYEERKPQHRETKTSFTDWFIGTYARAKETLALINDTESVLIQFWIARFTDRESQIAFVLVWPNARMVEDPDGRIVWILPDNLVSRQFLLNRGGVELTECVEITFSSRQTRAAFLAHTDD
ncbi:hypothetical protein K9U39_01400 [Rhodoblastus acidophilus]|uniref:Uncharacterized protein n=1 Tax=Candidatus Rhodoblastus alkanivorans TaxID=2954117 RepID=A0ABS9Z5F2_9HYPH|nr:hypothetical protein [Candidatus Rhodoblastus alkanivorans]MCI4680892.1 hypothetical protein [Candidatus Rhodoblastus alkanivorans]MCI4682306.1 hypothetical protein [Candidatus Rhodoblastus alkanivorans]MDI4639608.1 hypothetical protein [Rhodoblastus acidophilus]